MIMNRKAKNGCINLTYGKGSDYLELGIEEYAFCYLESATCEKNFNS